METSPNGAPVSIGKTVAAIEIKCPFPSENKMPVHYSLPPYYVCQCLAEMVILETNTLIYVSCSKQSATFFNVQFDSELLFFATLMTRAYVTDIESQILCHIDDTQRRFFLSV